MEKLFSLSFGDMDQVSPLKQNVSLHFLRKYLCNAGHVI